MEFVRPDINIDFMGKRKIGFILSAVLILISVGSLIVHKGPNYGIDFAGGTLIQIQFSESVAIDKIRDGIANIGLKDASIQKFGHDIDHEYLIRTGQSDMSSSGQIGRAHV